jgi:ABC-type dipeptide/oligopeptide/nickel transport system permease component
MKVSIVAISIAMVIGIALGMLAGYGPRWLDRLLIRSRSMLAWCEPRQWPCVNAILSWPNAPWAPRPRVSCSVT